MGESHIRSGRKKGFFVLLRDAAQDGRLSLETRGLFAMMMSLPDDWEYSVSGLAVKAGCGKDKTRRLLKELETVGYLVREQSHDNGGKFSGNIYVLQDEAPPLSGNTDNGENRQRQKPLPDITTQQSIDLTEEETKENTPLPPKGGKGRGRDPKKAPDWEPERFAKFWDTYPRGESKQAAIRAWDKLRPDPATLTAMARGLMRQMASESWQEGVGIPYAATWLNDRRWEDEPKRSGPTALPSEGGGRVVEDEGAYYL